MIRASPYNKRIEPTVRRRHTACLRKLPAGAPMGDPSGEGLPASPSG